MMGLFSIFDPISSLFTNWLSVFLPMLSLSIFMFYKKKSRAMTIISFIMNYISSEINSVFLNKKEKVNILIFSFIIFLIINNFLGVFPFVFTSTSHMVISLSLAFPLWLSSLMIGLLTNLKSFLTHLTPVSTPYVLMPFMVMIESVSIIIRPITLSVRLAANMIAGHLLLTLLGNLVVSQEKPILFVLMFSDFMLLTLESAVAFIQAYVFVILSVLYINENS